jgi:hypothetical protein
VFVSSSKLSGYDLTNVFANSEIVIREVKSILKSAGETAIGVIVLSNFSCNIIEYRLSQSTKRATSHSTPFSR